MRKLTGRRYEPITLPGFGNLRAQSLHEGERAIVEEFATNDQRRMKRVIVALSLVEELTPERVYQFDVNDPAELAKVIDELTSMDGSVVDRIVAASMRLNKITEADIKSLLGEPAAN
jgi:hypothetical protein